LKIKFASLSRGKNYNWD